jgi:hypothetical protein
MKKGSKIQILLSAVLLTAFGVTAAYSQGPIPEDKKRALHRFDPADIFPEEREATRGRPRRKQRSEREAEAGERAASPSTRLRSLDLPEAPAPAPRETRANPAPAPSLAPTPISETAPPAAPTAEPTPQPAAAGEVQSSGISASVNGGDHAGPGFPLYFLLPMIGLVLFALIMLIISLKKQLRTP